MGRTYRKVSQDEPLAQGDIFLGIPMPLVRFRDSVHISHQGNGLFQEAQVESRVEEGMCFVASATLVDAIILEQSCDTLRGDQVLLAPLRECDFGKKRSAKDRWGYISQLGTSLSQPSRIYLTNDLAFNFPRRFIDLSSKFSHSPEDLQHFIGLGHRHATLTDKGLVNLVARLTTQLSRVARDDIDWLSEDDLGIKVECLTVELESKRASLKTKRDQLAKTSDTGERERLEGEIEAAADSERDLGHELDVAKRALAQVRVELQGHILPTPSAVVNGAPPMNLNQKASMLQTGEWAGQGALATPEAVEISTAEQVSGRQAIIPVEVDNGPAVPPQVAPTEEERGTQDG